MDPVFSSLSSSQAFAPPDLERDYRRQVRKLYYKREGDFIFSLLTLES